VAGSRVQKVEGEEFHGGDLEERRERGRGRQSTISGWRGLK
jgi:hypothetical protein